MFVTNNIRVILFVLLDSSLASWSLVTSPMVRQLGTALRDFSEEECVKNEKLQVIGEIPQWLRGTYVRNGPGCWSVKEDGRAMHLFDGFAMMSRIELGESVSLTCKFLQSKAFNHAKNNGRRLFSEFGTPQSGMKELVLGLFQGLTTDNACVSFIQKNNKLIAMSEPATAAYEIDPESLETISQWLPSGPSTGLIQTAHGKFLCDELINIGTSLLPKPLYTVFQVNMETQQKKIIAQIKSQSANDAAWIHAFGLTKDGYVIFFETPAVYNVAALAGTGNAQHVTFDWKPQRGTWAHIVHIETGTVQTYKCPSNFFIFHCANAFSLPNENKICIDFAAFENANMIDALCLDNMSNKEYDIPKSRLARLTFDLNSLDNLNFDYLDNPLSSGSFCEFVHVNPAWSGICTHFVYGLGARRPTTAANILTKTSIKTRSTQQFQTYLDYVAFGEPTFVPRTHHTLEDTEDDGVVLAIAHTAQGEAHLLILDARQCSEIARIIIPFPGLPYGFHGLWTSSQV